MPFHITASVLIIFLVFLNTILVHFLSLLIFVSYFLLASFMVDQIPKNKWKGKNERKK